MTTLKLGDPAYWEYRYREEIHDLVNGFELFDWYCSFSSLWSEIYTLFDTSLQHKVLIVGIGRSDIIECLYAKGFRDITAIDISETIIIEMQRKYSSWAGVEFFVMDVRQLH